jgi:hypothetical protein
MPPKLSKYYLRAAILPMVISVLAGVLWLLLSNRWGLMGELKQAAKSEATELGWVFLLIILCNGAVFAVLTLPVFLNSQEKIRGNLWFSLLAWSLLPLIWLVYVILFANDSDLIVGADLEIRLVVLSMTLPFVIANGWTFIRYRRAVKAIAAFAAPATEA